MAKYMGFLLNLYTPVVTSAEAVLGCNGFNVVFERAKETIAAVKTTNPITAINRATTD